MMIDYQSMLALRKVMPAEIWQFREVFFHEGMQMLIGRCHRRYAQPSFFKAATRKFSGQAHLNGDGDLLIDHPGLPFSPDSIDPGEPDAAARWAWNLERRYRGAAPRGSFRITDLPGRIGGTQIYEGTFYVLKMKNRSDLASQNYQLPNAEDNLWAAGGRFTEPFNARHLAWRQFRLERSLDSWKQSDDIFVYNPEMRKMRRAATAWTDGLYLPRYSVSLGGAGGGMSFGASGAINPTAGQSIAMSQDARLGLTGLVLRPNGYIWRYVGEQDVITPINSDRPGYPTNPNRNFGVSGLSLASDRWDVRHAVVIEGALRKEDETIRTLTIYIDYQTQVPLYWVTRTDKRRLVEVGILAHRFSGDVKGYPNWPNGDRALVFDPVAAVFFNALEGAGGWRRESYDLISTPVNATDRRQMSTIEILDRGR